MSCLRIVAAIILAALTVTSAVASTPFTGGVWVKSNHPDPHNISVFYVAHQTVKAIGHGRIAGKPAIWYAQGGFRDGYLVLRYRYSPKATPRGWEPEGTMQLTLSKDGERLSGTARSLSGTWSGRFEFRRINPGHNP